MTGSLTERYDDRIAGVLSCYDRVVVTGTASAPGSAFITRSASTRAWAIARRVRPTKQNARGYVDDRLRRPAAPSPTSPPAQPQTTALMLTREKIEEMS